MNSLEPDGPGQNRLPVPATIGDFTKSGPAESSDDHGALPPLFEDRSFWGMTVTQFLGAFNDSVFKQIVLLLCVTVAVSASGETADKQFVAQAIFALAFILFSGISGFWSDRVTKRSIIVACKVGEIIVMVMAVGAFLAMTAPKIVQVAIESSSFGKTVISSYQIVGVPWLLLGVLFLMGTQSAVFGPAKYGILPEMVRARDLPQMNGMIQMTTFLALILGTWVGGILIDQFNQDLWKAGAICIGIAVLGTFTSLAIRRTRVAQPNAPFHWSALAVAPDTWSLLRDDRDLRRALWVYSLFWFVASIIPMAVNWLGTVQFGLSGEATSFMLATVSVGIAAGFILAGSLSAKRVNFGLVRVGALGLFITMMLLSLPDRFVVDASPQQHPTARLASPAETPNTAADNTSATSDRIGPLVGRWGSQILLVFAGFFAGLFALPVQVFLQSRPPERMKGRVIGTMNLINWVAIIIAAILFYPLAESTLNWAGLPKFGIFGMTGLILLPIAIFYRPADVEL